MSVLPFEKATEKAIFLMSCPAAHVAITSAARKPRMDLGQPIGQSASSKGKAGFGV